MLTPLTPAALADQLVARAKAGPLALCLDYDGTLANLAPQPALARIDPETRRLLERLARAPEVRVAIVSGRALEGLREVAGELAGVALAVSGGLQVVEDGGIWTHPEALAARGALQAVLRRIAPVVRAHPGAILEDKHVTLAVHFRQVPEAGPALRAALEEGRRTAGAPLRILDGKRVFEVQPDIAWDKGAAVAALLDRWGISGNALFAGDDVIDEPAHREVRRRGGVSVAVGAQPSEAEYRLQSPAELLQALGAVEEALARRTP